MVGRTNILPLAEKGKWRERWNERIHDGEEEEAYRRRRGKRWLAVEVGVASPDARHILINAQTSSETGDPELRAIR